jgi:hypothetical protein
MPAIAVAVVLFSGAQVHPAVIFATDGVDEALAVRLDERGDSTPVPLLKQMSPLSQSTVAANLNARRILAAVRRCLSPAHDELTAACLHDFVVVEASCALNFKAVPIAALRRRKYF